MSRSWDAWDDDDDWPIESKTYTQAHNDDGGGGSDEDDGHEYTKSSLDSDDRNLGKALQNVFLSDTKNQKSEENFDDDDDGEITEGGGSDGFNFEYPLRPYAEDCAFYLKTGTCKFKLACKFNHPLKRDFQGVKEKEGSVEETFNIPCKYYVTAGGCKFGEACKFKHSKNENIMETPELNFLGLPIRLGEKECPFYMRTGSCAYGARCKFHHPDPTDLVTSDPEDEAQDDSLEKASDSWEDHARESDPVPASTESQPAAEPWAPHMIMRQTALYLENRTSSSPEAGEDQSSKDWNEYQHMQTPTEETEQTTLNTQVNPSVEENDSPLYYFRPTEEIEQATLNAQVNNALEKDNGPLYYLRLVNVDEFPERPGQPKCSYYMKTGDCKFRSACRYHHPKNRYSKLHNGPLGNRHMNQNFFFQLENLWKDDLASEGDNLSDNTKILTYQQQRRSEEFPERPGQPECNYFIKTGDCKRRSSCRYHHPKNYHSTVCLLNNKGLPLRPGTQVCDYFKRFGICKFGRLCSFDHSEGLVSLNLSRRSTLMSHQEASL